jgi:hypothetical protein
MRVALRRFRMLRLAEKSDHPAWQKKLGFLAHLFWNLAYLDTSVYLFSILRIPLKSVFFGAVILGKAKTFFVKINFCFHKIYVFITHFCRIAHVYFRYLLSGFHSFSLLRSA